MTKTTILAGPVYMIDNKHQFYEVIEPKTGIKELVGPVYGVGDKFEYNLVQPRPDRITRLEGPVYNIEETRHHCNELNKVVESVKALTAPVYDVGPFKSLPGHYQAC